MMLDYWQQRSPKEQKLLVVGLLVVCVGLIYHMIWKPLDNKVTALKKLNQQNAQLYEWMQQHKDQVLNTQTTPKTKKALFGLVQTYFNDMNDKAVINRVNEHTVIVKFESVAFDEFIKQLEKLQQASHISVEQFQSRKLEKPGLASISCTITQ